MAALFLRLYYFMLNTFRIPLYFLIAIWAIFILDYIIPLDFTRLGIIPRDFSGLKGILFSPLLHGDFQHILLNSLPLLLLGSIIALHGAQVFISVTAIIWFIGGLIVWLFSSPAIVVGASGLIFGYWAFVLTWAIRHKTLKSILLACIVLVLYGSLFYSFFRLEQGVSYIGHLGGAIAGVFAAGLINPTRKN